MEVGGIPAGRLYLDRKAPLWRLAEVTLAAAARGRGHGRALLAWLQATARRAGAQGIDLHVLGTNRRAAALYLRLGFADAADADAVAATHRRMVWRVS